jgi:hypothetical protein
LVGPNNPVVTNGKPESFTIRFGGARATLTEVPPPATSTGQALAVPLLNVTYEGAQVFRGEVYDVTTYLVTEGKDRGTGPAGLGPVPLCLTMFPGNSAPTVLVSQFTGGSLGLGAVEAFHPTAQGGPWSATSAEIIGSWGLRPIGGQVVIESGASVYFFGPEPLAGWAVRLLQFRGQRFEDVTDRFPEVVRADAVWQWAAFHAHHGLGPLAAWVADECTLGRRALALGTIGRLQSESRLRPTTTFPGMPSGQAFARYATRVCAGVAQMAPLVPPS